MSELARLTPEAKSVRMLLEILARDSGGALGVLVCVRMPWGHALRHFCATDDPAVEKDWICRMVMEMQAWITAEINSDGSEPNDAGIVDPA